MSLLADTCLASVLGTLCGAVTVASCASLPVPPARVETAFAHADTLVRTPLVPGVAHVYIRDLDGPWAIHILDIDRLFCRPRLRAAKAGPPLSQRARTSTLGTAALAAVNGDFFALPAGTPVGAHVSGGETYIGPGLRPAFAVGAADYHAGALVVRGHLAVPADTLRVTQVNRPRAGDAQHPPLGGATLLTPWIGAATPIDSGASVILIRVLSGDARSGRGVIHTHRAALDPLPFEGGVAFSTDDDAWVHRRSAGDTVTWRVEVGFGGGDGPVTEALGGFPLLVQGGRDVLPEQPGVSASFGDARHPRTAIGWNAARLYMVAVDGRQAAYSDGMTLPELRDLFLRLGAATALNLDGGGSTAMVVRGRVANRPSDEQGERSVGNALLLDGCGEG